MSDGPIIRFSHLKTLGTLSPAHLRCALDSGEDEQTSAMARGTATHAILFGTRKVVSWEEGRPRRGKDWEAFQAYNHDAEILSYSDYQKAIGMAEAVRNHPLAGKLFAPPAVLERTIYFEMDGRKCRATPDAVRNDPAGDWLGDLKTSFTSSPDRFPWLALKSGYHGQLDFYREARERLGFSRPKHFYLTAVESEKPFCVTVFSLTDRALEAGNKLWRLWWERFRVCEESGVWPGYAQSCVDLDVPDNEFSLDFADTPEAAAADDR